MMDRTMQTLTLIAAFCLATTAAAQAASSDDSAPPPPIAADKVPADAEIPPAFLAGPQVSEEKVTDPADALRRDGRAEITVPIRRWIRTVLELEMSADQHDAVEKEIVEWRQANRKFQQEHGEEMSELREQIRAARDGAMDSIADAEALQQRAEEIGAKAPQVEEYQQRIWKMLDEPQQEQLREKLEEIRRQLMERRRRAVRGSDRMMDDDAMNDDGDAARPGRRGERQPPAVGRKDRGRRPAMEERPGRPRSPRQRDRQRGRDGRVAPEEPGRAPGKVGG